MHLVRAKRMFTSLGADPDWSVNIQIKKVLGGKVVKEHPDKLRGQHLSGQRRHPPPPIVLRKNKSDLTVNWL